MRDPHRLRRHHEVRREPCSDARRSAPLWIRLMTSRKLWRRSVARMVLLVSAAARAFGLIAACGSESGSFGGGQSGSFQARPAGATAVGSTP